MGKKVDTTQPPFFCPIGTQETQGHFNVIILLINQHICTSLLVKVIMQSLRTIYAVVLYLYSHAVLMIVMVIEGTSVMLLNHTNKGIQPASFFALF